jgi:hypothetical protein
MPQIFHLLLALIAYATNNELAKYVDYLKVENRILRARLPGQVHWRSATYTHAYVYLWLIVGKQVWPPFHDDHRMHFDRFMATRLA